MKQKILIETSSKEKKFCDRCKKPLEKKLKVFGLGIYCENCYNNRVYEFNFKSARCFFCNRYFTAEKWLDLHLKEKYWDSFNKKYPKFRWG